MNFCEGAGLFSNVRRQADRIEPRDQSVHEHPFDPRDRAVAPRAAFSEGARMLKCIDRASNYIDDRGLLEAQDG